MYSKSFFGLVLSLCIQISSFLWTKAAVTSSTVIEPFAFDPFGWRSINEVSITDGDIFMLGPHNHLEGDTWRWTGPNGFTLNEREVVVQHASADKYNGKYTVTFTAKNGQRYSANFMVHIYKSPCPVLIRWVKGGNKDWQMEKRISVNAGMNFSLRPVEANNYPGTWHWTGPNNFVSNKSQVDIRNASKAQAGTYTVTFYASDGRRTREDYYVTVNGSGNTKITTTKAKNIINNNKKVTKAKITTTKAKNINNNNKKVTKAKITTTKAKNIINNNKKITKTKITTIKVNNKKTIKPTIKKINTKLNTKVNNTKKNNTKTVKAKVITTRNIKSKFFKY